MMTLIHLHFFVRGFHLMTALKLSSINIWNVNNLPFLNHCVNNISDIHLQRLGRLLITDRKVFDPSSRNSGIVVSSYFGLGKIFFGQNFISLQFSTRFSLPQTCAAVLSSSLLLNVTQISHRYDGLLSRTIFWLLHSSNEREKIIKKKFKAPFPMNMFLFTETLHLVVGDKIFDSVSMANRFLVVFLNAFL